MCKPESIGYPREYYLLATVLLLLEAWYSRRQKVIVHEVNYTEMKAFKIDKEYVEQLTGSNLLLLGQYLLANPLIKLYLKTGSFFILFLVLFINRNQIFSIFIKNHPEKVGV